MASEISLKLSLTSDLDDGYIRIDQTELRALGIAPGDVVALRGAKHTAYARAKPSHMEERNQGLVRVSANMLRNLGSDEDVSIGIEAAAKPLYAESVTLKVHDSLDKLYIATRQETILRFWRDRIVTTEDVIRIQTLDRSPLDVVVESSEPQAPVLIGSATKILFSDNEPLDSECKLAGLRDLYRTCENAAKKCLFDNAEDSVRFAYLYGPSGCGKGQLVKKIASSLKVNLETLDVHRFIDHLENLSNPEDVETDDLGSLVMKLTRYAPVILLVDHLEACETRRLGTSAISMLTSFFENLRIHEGVFVFAIGETPLPSRFLGTNFFDVVFPLDLPERLARQEMLMATTEKLALASEVDLSRIALMTRGYTMAEIQLLCTMASKIATGGAISEDDFIRALSSITPGTPPSITCETPDISWDEIGGLDDVKNLLRETLMWSLRYRERFSEIRIDPPRAILLSGGQGTGKTSLIRALPGIVPVHFIEVACPTLARSDEGKTIQFLSDVFQLARRKTPCLVFLDDIDALFDESEDEAKYPLAPPSIVSSVLALIDKLPQMPGVVVIAATSRPDRLHEEMLRRGRFDFAMSLPQPDLTARKRILQIHSRQLPLAADVDFDHLAVMTQNLPPAEIASLCSRAGIMALRNSFNEEMGGVPPVVNAALFEQILRGRKS